MLAPYPTPMEVFSSPFPPNKPACSSFLRTAPGSAGVFTAWGSIQYPFSCTMQAPRGIRGFSSGFPQSIQLYSICDLCCFDGVERSPRACGTENTRGHFVEMVLASKETEANTVLFTSTTHEEKLPKPGKKYDHQRDSRQAIKPCLLCPTNPSSLNVTHTLCKTSKQPHSSTSAQRCVAAIKSAADRRPRLNNVSNTQQENCY